MCSYAHSITLKCLKLNKQIDKNDSYFCLTFHACWIKVQRNCALTLLSLTLSLGLLMFYIGSNVVT